MSHWHDSKSGRELWVLDAESVDDWPELPPWTSPGFCLFFAAERVMNIDRLARRALDQGLAFACAWGPGCAMIEDDFDEVVVGDGSRPEATDVLTTSHPDESLDEALEFFLDAVTPAPAREPLCEAWVVFAIGAPLRTRVEKTLRRRRAEPRG
jgi:hypothetical protein